MPLWTEMKQVTTDQQTSAMNTLNNPPNPPPVAPTQWAQINDKQVIVATPDRKCLRTLDTASGQDPYATPMTGPGDKVTTRQLLDAAWCAGMAAARPSGEPLRRSLPRYVRELIGSYFLTSATPKLLREMGERFTAMNRPDLALFATRFARLEDGDQAMAAEDLHALGYHAEDLVRNCEPPPMSVTLRDYFASLVRGPEPIEGLGYAYAIERSSLSITEEDLQELGRVVPAGIDAMTCRRHHSGVGGDVVHVKYFIHACSRLPAEDRARIARATYEAMTYISSLAAEDGAEDEVLEKQYSRYRLQAGYANVPVS